MHKSNAINNINTPNKNLSDSEESTTSETPSDNSNNGNELTLLAEYDEYLRLLNQEIKEIVTSRDVLPELTESLGEALTRLKFAKEENQRLQMELDRKTQETSDLESKLNMARKLLDLEKKNTRKVEADKTILVS